MTDVETNSNAGDANASPALRYVVLYHDGIADPHFDLMIESQPGGPLYTWRCPQNPVTQYVTVAARIANHRREYLDYEGPISGNRGRVTRVAAGVGRLERVRPRAWMWQLRGSNVTWHRYLLAPAVVRGNRRWVIEGHASA
jgi:hypothetical protein